MTSLTKLWIREIRSQLMFSLPSEFISSGVLDNILLPYCSSPYVIRKRKFDQIEGDVVVDWSSMNWTMVRWSIQKDGVRQTSQVAKFRGFQSLVEIAQWLLFNRDISSALWAHLGINLDFVLDGPEWRQRFLISWSVFDEEFDHSELNRLYQHFRYIQETQSGKKVVPV